MAVVPPSLPSPDEIQHLCQAFQAFQHSTQMLLADAADAATAVANTDAAIADAAATAPAAATAATQQAGWWYNYINIFKHALELVHSTVDGPLRAAGIEQTWGISIFLFTAGTYCNGPAYIHAMLYCTVLFTTVYYCIRSPSQVGCFSLSLSLSQHKL